MLYGRDAERSCIGELLAGARGSESGVLVIRGDAGVGKSALLEDARAAAPDMRVLVARGTESEARLPFAAAQQLLRPVLGLIDELPVAQADALRGALGLGTGGGDRFLISLAVLSLLAEAAERDPLLCLVDDAHWLDGASADALVFAARRLDAERIAIIFAARAGDVRAFDAPGLPELWVGGLDPPAAQALLDRELRISLTPAARDRLIDGTGGNPLALLALPTTLSEAQLTGAEPLLEPLPVSTRVERAFAARVHALSENAQALLLVAAADDRGELAAVLRASAALGAGADAVDEAERSELLRIDGGRLEFRHPLVRSAVYHGATLSRRQAAHRALAGALDSNADADRRAWHRAAATVEPDASVVEELEQAAHRARQRSAFAAASLAFERAAALTADPDLRAPRLTAAAENAMLAGRRDRAVMLLGRGHPLASDALQRADIDRWRGLIELNSGSPADAYALLYRAAVDVAPVDPKRALHLLNIASVAASFAGDGAGAIAIAQLVHTLDVGETTLERMIRRGLVGFGLLAKGEFERAAATLHEVLELRGALDDAALLADPPAYLFAGRATLFLGDDHGVYDLHRRLAVQAREKGMLGSLVQALPRLAHAEIWSGQWRSALASAREGHQLATEIGQDDLIAHTLTVLALIAAMHGEEEECRARAAESRELASARGLAFSVDCSHWAIALLELAAGRADEAFRAARDISGILSSFWSGFDRVEAAIRAGELQAARDWLDPFEHWARCSTAAWACAGALHCRALLCDDAAEAERLFREALETHAHAERPFERARTELAFGEFLRRARRRIEAREHLHAALDAFDSLGAHVWVERAQAELRASGQTARRRDPSTRDTLTAQELQVANLVAQGLSNREVAAQLFLSPRTIDFHLRNVFRKLAITSRVQLTQLELGRPHVPA